MRLTFLFLAFLLLLLAGCSTKNATDLTSSSIPPSSSETGGDVPASASGGDSNVLIEDSHTVSAPELINMTVGEQAQIDLNLTGYKNPIVEFRSEVEETATVDENGVITAFAPGPVNIYVVVSEIDNTDIAVCTILVQIFSPPSE